MIITLAELTSHWGEKVDLVEESRTGNHITSYVPGTICINETAYHQSIILTREMVKECPNIAAFVDITPSCVIELQLDDIEMVIIGCGEEQSSHPVELMAEFLRHGLSCEVMLTSAACRTYNILASDQRKVVAIMIIE